MKNFLFLVLGIAIGAAGGWFGHAHYCCKINCQNCCPAKPDCCPAPVKAEPKAAPAGKAVKECATPVGAAGAAKQEATVPAIPPAKE